MASRVHFHIADTSGMPNTPDPTQIILAPIDAIKKIFDLCSASKEGVLTPRQQCLAVHKIVQAPVAVVQSSCGIWSFVASAVHVLGQELFLGNLAGPVTSVLGLGVCAAETASESLLLASELRFRRNYSFLFDQKILQKEKVTFGDLVHFIDILHANEAFLKAVLQDFPGILREFTEFREKFSYWESFSTPLGEEDAQTAKILVLKFQLSFLQRNFFKLSSKEEETLPEDSQEKLLKRKKIRLAEKIGVQAAIKIGETSEGLLEKLNSKEGIKETLKSGAALMKTLDIQTKKKILFYSLGIATIIFSVVGLMLPLIALFAPAMISLPFVFLGPLIPLLSFLFISGYPISTAVVGMILLSMISGVFGVSRYILYKGMSETDGWTFSWKDVPPKFLIKIFCFFLRHIKNFHKVHQPSLTF